MDLDEGIILQAAERILHGQVRIGISLCFTRRFAGLVQRCSRLSRLIRRGAHQHCLRWCGVQQSLTRFQDAFAHVIALTGRGFSHAEQLRLSISGSA